MPILTCRLRKICQIQRHCLLADKATELLGSQIRAMIPNLTNAASSSMSASGGAIMFLLRLVGMDMADEASNAFGGGTKAFLHVLGFALPLVGIEQIVPWYVGVIALPYWFSFVLIVAGAPIFWLPAIWKTARAFWNRSKAITPAEPAVQISIISPLNDGVLENGKDTAQAAHRYLARAKVSNLPHGHKVWFVHEKPRTGEIWPQEPAISKTPDEWEAWTFVWDHHNEVTIVAVVAPPTSNDYFEYYHTVRKPLGAQGPIPLPRIPPECTVSSPVHLHRAR